MCHVKGTCRVWLARTTPSHPGAQSGFVSERGVSNPAVASFLATEQPHPQLMDWEPPFRASLVAWVLTAGSSVSGPQLGGAEREEKGPRVALQSWPWSLCLAPGTMGVKR